MSIKKLPPDDRPREKIWAKGVGALSNAELLAVLLRTGGRDRSALDIARALAATPEQFARLKLMKPAELALEKGIGPAKAVTVVAALELGRRLAHGDGQERLSVGGTADAVALLAPKLRYEEKEVFLALMLGAKGQVLAIEKIAQGSLLSSVVLPRDIFQAAIMHRAAAVIVAHNHPSGNPKPSGADRELTRRAVGAGGIMGIAVIDHIIIGEGKYYSFSEQGLI
ncbi:MAG: DNA repair protein RadC [Acidaminococcales bacterium]|nr:DNA repair protein RadC [Acidaminococcales bacterium]